MNEQSFRLEDMVKGWFIGPFSPSCLNTDACEVAVKHYSAGDKEDAHYHKVATEITVVVSGTVRMLGKTWSSGDIIMLEPGIVTNFEAITDAVNVVVKLPGARNDKYLAQASN